MKRETRDVCFYRDEEKVQLMETCEQLRAEVASLRAALDAAERECCLLREELAQTTRDVPPVLDNLAAKYYGVLEWRG